MKGRLGLGAVVMAAAAVALSAAQAGSAYDAQFAAGRELLQRHEYFEALKAFERANRIAGGRSAESLLGMARAMEGLRVYTNALDACRSAIDAAGADEVMLARAHTLEGQVLEAMGRLPDAEAEYRAALRADPDSSTDDLHYLLGAVLVAQHRDEDGAAELRQQLERRPYGPAAERARALLGEPHADAAPRAPAFSFTATGGQPISLEALGGKVVLLDFWASWCGPCVRALPSVRRLQQAHARDPFVLVSISADRDERPWRAFVSRNGMTWPQYWDRDHRLQALFAVRAIPTYVLIDAEGKVRLRVAGAGFDRARALTAEVERQLALLAQARM